MGTRERKWLLVPALPFLVWLALHAYRWGTADAAVNDALRAMGGWSASGRQAPLADWLEVRNELLRAERRAPGDPAVQELLGALHVQRAETPEFAELARERYVLALERRPGSPYAWASLAQSLYRQGQTGSLFEAALVNAITLGPSEAEVQMVVADHGLAVFDESSPATRAAVERAVGAGMRRDPVAMLKVSERRGRLEAACRHAQGNKRLIDPKWVQRCATGEVT